MRVSVFGAGYVGCVTAACLAAEGHPVIAVDIDPIKIAALEEGRAPFFEPGLSELIGKVVASGGLHATTDAAEAIRKTDASLICVGTPSRDNGFINLEPLKKVFASIGRELRRKSSFHVVILRSTVLPNAVRDLLIPLLEVNSEKRVGEEIGFAYNPEFLREGSAIRDFREAPWTLVGCLDGQTFEVVSKLYETLPAPIIRTDPSTAVLVKYLSNAYHALKVAFANEASRLCRELDVNSAEVMEIFCRDANLNISARYLKPGFAFGGSCLPKDLKALTCEAARLGVDLPVIHSILASNELHLRKCVDVVVNTGRRKVGIVGLTFKAGTDDLRESPSVQLAESLIGKGFDVRIYEPNLAPGKIYGSNLAFIERSIPHIWKLLVSDLTDLLNHAEIVVVTQALSPGDRERFTNMRASQVCLDLAKSLTPDEVNANYEGLDVAPHLEAALV